MITQELRYAMVLVEEAQSAKREAGSRNQETVRSVAEKYGLSVKFLEQVARKLRKAGLIVSRRGRQGGYHLVSLHVSLGDLLAALGCSLSAVYCRLSEDCPGGAVCYQRELEARFVGNVNDQLQNIKVI